MLSQEIHVKYQQTAEELAAAQMIFFRFRAGAFYRNILRGMIYLFGGLMLAALAVAYVRRDDGENVPEALVVATALALLIPIVGYSEWLLSALQQRIFERRSDRDLWVEWTITDDRLDCVVGRTAAVTYPWKEFDQCIECPEGFLLCVGDNSNISWLPRRGFREPADVSGFATLAHRKIPGYQSAPWLATQGVGDPFDP